MHPYTGSLTAAITIIFYFKVLLTLYCEHVGDSPSWKCQASQKEFLYFSHLLGRCDSNSTTFPTSAYLQTHLNHMLRPTWPF